MATVDVQARLEYARAAVAVLRVLRITDRTIRYKEFAVAIGLMAENDTWQPWHRQQVGEILNLVAATEHQAGENARVEPLQYERIVNQDGQPGMGFHKTSRIVTS